MKIFFSRIHFICKANLFSHTPFPKLLPMRFEYGVSNPILRCPYSPDNKNSKLTSMNDFKHHSNFPFIPQNENKELNSYSEKKLAGEMELSETEISTRNHIRRHQKSNPRKNRILNELNDFKAGEIESSEIKMDFENEISNENEILNLHQLNSKMKRNKRMCYYFTQEQCTRMDDPHHMSIFLHDLPNLPLPSLTKEKLKNQPFDYLLVLDLEGRVEILELPVIVLCTKTLKPVDFFHRFVRPTKMSEKRINEYIAGKYGKFGLAQVWHDTALPFPAVLSQLEIFLAKRKLLDGKCPKLKNAAFVTCGNWDIKTKIPEQCRDSNMQLPAYFHEWINIKDVYLNFYKQNASGMVSMLRGLRIPLSGSHHVGFEDALNITRIAIRLLCDGAILSLTALRMPTQPNTVKFLFRKRVK